MLFHRSRVCATLLVLIVGSAPHTQAQQPYISPDIKRTEGTDADNHVTYIRLHLFGALVPAMDTLPPPTLTAQCTKQPAGKLGFELFANFGGIDDFAYHRPWMPKDRGLFAPRTDKAVVIMEFVGYTRVKPVKRQWEMVEVPRGQLRYNTPSGGSSNMEDIPFYLQYLKALPTLKLTYAGKTAQFLVTPLFDEIRRQPLCRASGL